MTAKVADENGDEFEIVDPDVKALIGLLEYGRRRGYRIGPTVQINNSIFQVADLRQNEMPGVDRKPERTIWEENADPES